jgi:hypothetical protein
MKTSCGGSLPKEGCFLLNPSTVSWIVMMALFPLEDYLAN